MNWLPLICSSILLVCLTQTYHLNNQFREHSTTLDYIRTFNKTVEGVLKGNFNLKCTACEAVVETLQILLKSDTPKEEIIHVIGKVCTVLHIENQRVCSLVTEEFGQEFVEVVADLLLRPSWLCYAALGPECGEPIDLLPFWNVTIPPNKPKRKPLIRPREGMPTLKVVQLSDVHIDLKYKPGSKTKCSEPLCCREGESSTGGENAGFWGSLNANCDIPIHTFYNALEFIAKEIKPDLIIWTGDIPAHNVWNQTREQQLHHIQLAADGLTQHLPRTRVFPSLGNHESVPADSFPPPGVAPEHLSNDWLNKFVEKVWSRWLPPLDTIGYGGYYAVQYSQYLRIISLNTQYCDNLNFWLYLNGTDPAGQLGWLVQELIQAEKLHIKVIILGHIPTGKSDCLKAFSWNYYKIVDRFESTIVGQFVGHTHKDEFALFYSEEPDHHPTSFQFISPSLTTFSDMKPALRVYILDGDYAESTFRPLETQTYTLDLERANERNETVWELEYTSSKAYNLTWLTPDNMQTLYKRFEADRDFFNETYLKFKYHNRPENTCDVTCYKLALCYMKTGRSHDPSICPPFSLTEQHHHHLLDKMC